MGKTRKPEKKPKAKARPALTLLSVTELKRTIAAQAREIREGVEQQAATSAILRMIAKAPGDLRAVLDALAECAARLCDAKDAQILQLEGDLVHRVATYGDLPVALEHTPYNRETPAGRAMIERQMVHIPDLSAVVESEFPVIKDYQQFIGHRTTLAVPLLRDGFSIGAILIRRLEVRPFSDAQIKLLETFADQAVIAIENARLFQERETRNRDLAALHDVTTAASQSLEIKPVLDEVVKKITEIFAFDSVSIYLFDPQEDNLNSAASFGTHEDALHPGAFRRGQGLTGRVAETGEPIVFANVKTDPRYQELSQTKATQQRGYCFFAIFPINSKQRFLGTINCIGKQPRQLIAEEIRLIRSMCDQIGVAVDNINLFEQVKSKTTELEISNVELREALEQQTATSEILSVIASSPTDVKPVLDAIVRSATRLCDASFGSAHRYDGQQITIDAGENYTSEQIAIGQQRFPTPATRGTAVGRAILDRDVVHIADVREDPEYEVYRNQTEMRFRTVLAVPLLKDGTPIGALGMWRSEVKPFTENQINLLKTFADQAVIAIENVRLFNELKQSLEQQTATSEILGVIAGSPTDIQPVLDVVIANAVRLAGATKGHIRQFDGQFHRVVAHHGESPEEISFLRANPLSAGPDTPIGRVFVERRPVHILDVQFSPGRDISIARQHGVHTLLAVPLIRQGTPIGGIIIWRDVVEAFSERQIELVKTFADQAVIAIENVRLFKELQERNRDLTEALEQQTATSEILRVIASSPTDLQPVFDAIVGSAARLCEATFAALHRFDGQEVTFDAQHGMTEPEVEESRRRFPRPLGRDISVGRAILDRQIAHIHDIRRDPEYNVSAGQRSLSFRTVLAVPLLREGNAVGALGLWRREVQPFSDKQIELVKTFADQAVIAIENVRLFKELEKRTRELVESVEEMKALSEVGQAVSSSLDLETVLETIVARAVDLSGTDCGVIYEYDEAVQEFNLRASHRMEAEAVEGLRAARIKLGEGATGQAAMTRAPVQIADTFGQREGSVSRLRPLLNRLGYRSLLTVPILRDHQIMGGLTVWRRQVGEFEPEVVNLLQTFATQSALAIHNARLFREIEDKGRQLEAANRHKSEFLANVSHELRTPLNAIIGFSEVLGERMFGELNEKQAEYTEDILSSGRHLLSLINDILDLSKIEAGRMELEVTTFDLPMAIENALLLVRERASRHGIKLARVIDDRLGDFTGDERKIKQILVNLLSNAVKFTPEGGQIKVDASLGDSAVIISVTDTGIGIAEGDQEAIFEEFRQAGGNYAQKREGTGLGLTLTRKFVEMHSGKIWVESEVGRGSTFTFTLPISPHPFPLPEGEG